MRIARSTLIGTAVATALFGGTGVVCAQQATTQLPPTGEPLQEVVVTGIRASLQQSIEMQKEATTFIKRPMRSLPPGQRVVTIR